jgi:hypothetical protein
MYFADYRFNEQSTIASPINTKKSKRTKLNNNLTTTTAKVANPMYMFTLLVGDETAQTEVIIRDIEGEMFFGGISAKQFYAFPNIQYVIATVLNTFIREKRHMDFYLWSYKVEPPMNSTNSNHQNHDKFAYVTRLAVVNTVLFKLNIATNNANDTTTIATTTELKK